MYINFYMYISFLKQSFKFAYTIFKKTKEYAMYLLYYVISYHPYSFHKDVTNICEG